MPRQGASISISLAAELDATFGGKIQQEAKVQDSTGLTHSVESSLKSSLCQSQGGYGFKRGAAEKAVSIQLRKTKLCRYVAKRCRNGESCPFAHSPGQLNATPDLTKTSICNRWRAGCCSMPSSDCRFAHGEQDLRSTLRDGSRAMKEGNNEQEGASLLSHVSSFSDIAGNLADILSESDMEDTEDEDMGTLQGMQMSPNPVLAQTIGVGMTAKDASPWEQQPKCPQLDFVQRMALAEMLRQAAPDQYFD